MAFVCLRGTKRCLTLFFAHACACARWKPTNGLVCDVLEWDNFIQ